MALQKSSYTEGDLIQAVVLKKQFQTAFSAIQSNGAGAVANLADKEHKEQRREMIKMALKVWYACNKFVKSQCKKDRVVDTLNFGTFCKAGTLDSANAASHHFVYCPGPRAIFTLVQNSENVSDVP